jgi:hypothetical protein
VGEEEVIIMLQQEEMVDLVVVEEVEIILLGEKALEEVVILRQHLHHKEILEEILRVLEVVHFVDPVAGAAALVLQELPLPIQYLEVLEVLDPKL